MDIQEFLDEYKEVGEELHTSLEQAYSMSILSEDYDRANDILKTLMKYRFIESSDARLDKKHKIFGQYNDVKFFGALDYRRETEERTFVPDCFLLNVDNVRTTIFKVLPHWGKRVEGAYSGDVKMEKTYRGVTMWHLHYEKEIQASIRGIQEICDKYSVKVNEIDDINKLAMAGAARIIQIGHKSPVLNGHQTLGYAVVRPDDEARYHIKVYVDYSKVIEYWILIKDFIEEVRKELRSMVSSESAYDPEFIIESDESCKIQDRMIKDDKASDDYNRRLKEKEEIEAIAKQKEKERKQEEAEKKRAEAAERRRNKKKSGIIQPVNGQTDME